MSHYTVTVIVKDPADLDQALAPFDENGEWFSDGSRWDWWVLGGRWSDELVDRAGRKGNAFRKAEIDWDAVGAGMLERLRETYRYYCGEGATWARGDYAVRDGESEDDYARRLLQPFTTHAFLGLDGVWHENGRMGCFGVTVGGEEGEQRDSWPMEYQRLLAEVPDDAFVCIVDCHV